MLDSLEEIVPLQMTGEENFSFYGKPLPLKVSSFWGWACSDLLSNSFRGILAEYIVGSALGCLDKLRLEWDMYDFITHNDVKVEVKSCAYVQSWKQKRHSSPRFGIRETTSYDAATATYMSEKRRQSDVYVFCLLHHIERDTLNPLELSQWTFFVISAAELTAQVKGQKSIGLSNLKMLNPITTTYSGIAGAVETVGRQARDMLEIAAV